MMAETMKLEIFRYRPEKASEMRCSVTLLGDFKAAMRLP